MTDAVALTHPWIGGKPFEAPNARTEDLISPWNGELVARVAMADDESIDAAIESARAAFVDNLRATAALTALCCCCCAGRGRGFTWRSAWY